MMNYETKNMLTTNVIKKTFLRINESLENYPKVSVGNAEINLTKFIRILPTGTLNLKTGGSGGYLLTFWQSLCIDRNESGKVT